MTFTWNGLATKIEDILPQTVEDRDLAKLVLAATTRGVNSAREGLYIIALFKAMTGEQLTDTAQLAEAFYQYVLTSEDREMLELQLFMILEAPEDIIGLKKEVH